jgi:predicted RND superfamily exporter protein
MIAALEELVFRNRGLVLALLGLLTVVGLGLTTRLTLDSAMETHLPAEHEYIQTFLEYQEYLGTGRVLVVLRARQGDIWNVESIRKLKQVTDTLAALPGIDRRTVTSLWTPNITYMELTEEGLHTEDVIGVEFTAETLTQEGVERIRNRVRRGGLHGRLVASDDTAAMVVGTAAEVDPETGEKLDRLDLAARVESGVRQKLSDDAYEIHVVGAPTMIGDIASGVQNAIMFLLPLTLLLTVLLLHAWTRCWRLTWLPLVCSLASLIWQLGFVGLMAYGFDPLLILIPLLVFVVGVVHGIPQAQVIAERVAAGDDAMAAARAAFRRLLLPGSLALLASAAAFFVMSFVPIHTVRAVGIAAAFGAVSKIVSNLVLLPVLASYGGFDASFAHRAVRMHELGTRLAGAFGAFARRGPAFVVVGVCVVLFALSARQLPGRHFGDEHPGSTELRPGSRYNRDAHLFTSRFVHRMDLLSLIAETPKESCIDYEVIDYIDRLTWHMQNVPGVHSVMSATPVARYLTAMWNEGNPKWTGIPRNRYGLMQAMSSVPSALGVFNADCSVMLVQVFTDDHEEKTIRRVTGAAKAFRDANPSERIRLRLASGGIAVQGATNEVLEAAERPMLFWALAAAFVLAMFGWRDWRAPLACCAPLVLGTLLGYAFMTQLGIGVMTSTLPVLALGIGLGSTFAFYLWDRLRQALAQGAELPEAWRQTLRQAGGAVIRMALVLVLGAAVWGFSAISLQAEMGRLLAVLLLVHGLLAVTVLPALAALLGAGPAHRESERRTGQ